jgi:hypothetical protein
MKFDFLFEELINQFKPSDGKTVAILPGGFKPPHKGHFDALNYLLEEADSGIVYVGGKVREGVNITAEQSKQIWDIYKKYLSKPVEVYIATDIKTIPGPNGEQPKNEYIQSPIQATYQYANTHNNENIIVGIGPEEDPNELKRYATFQKNPEKYPLVKIVNIPPMHERISGTAIRQKIASGAKDAVDYFIPTHNDGSQLISNQDKQKIAKILGI